MSMSKWNKMQSNLSCFKTSTVNCVQSKLVKYCKEADFKKGLG